MEVEMRAISAVVGLVVLLTAAAAAQEAGEARPSLLKATFSKLPIYFVENRGVYPDEVAYYVQGADKTLFFTKDGITFRLKGKDKAWVVKLEFVGANPDVVPRGEDRQQAVFSYFRGPEKDWKTGLRTFGRVVYEDLWPGIDLVYEGTVNRLKYEFAVKPGADPGKIKLRYRGVTEVEVTKQGGLRVETPVGSFADEPPKAWQKVDGARVAVEMGFLPASRTGQGGHAFGFRLGDYDRTLPLTLDPVIMVYCGYIGGSAPDFASGIAADGSGNAYVVGGTDSNESTFPVTVGPDLTFNGPVPQPRFLLGDIFVAKVNASGSALVYCGYIGGSGKESATDIAIDLSGNVYVTGETSSTQQTFPVKVGPDLTYNGGLAGFAGDAFVAKLNASGTALDYCGYIGGSGPERAFGIAIDASGNAYVAGETGSTQSSFPVVVGPDLTHNGAAFGDGFVAKVNATGSGLVYCGYIGGTGADSCADIAVDKWGNAYVTGVTQSRETSFPVMVGPDLTFNGGTPFGGGTDAFVAKVNAAGTMLDYCGYIGGRLDDFGNGVTVDSSSNAYVVGGTASTETSFPVKIGPDLTYNGGGTTSGDAFVAKVNALGTALLYCGYIGGSGIDQGTAIALDGAGGVYLGGSTDSSETTFPVRGGPDSTYNGGGQFFGGDAFVARVSPTGKVLDFCGYVGGSENDGTTGIAVDGRGAIHVAGATTSREATFPVRVGPDLTYNGGFNVPTIDGDGFVCKLAYINLIGRGAPNLGGKVDLLMLVGGDHGLPYQLGTSLGTGPIPIDTRKLDLSPDALLAVTVASYWPSIFSGYRGVIDSMGQAQAAIHIPNVPALIGLRLHSAFVTLDPAAPSGIRSISNTFSFSITK